MYACGETSEDLLVFANGSDVIIDGRGVGGLRELLGIENRLSASWNIMHYEEDKQTLTILPFSDLSTLTSVTVEVPISVR